MQVHINEVVSRVKAVDGESLLSQSVMQRIVAAAVQVLEEMQAREHSRNQDTKLDSETSGAGEG